MRDGFYRAGFLATLVSTAFLLGLHLAGGGQARAEGGSVPAGGAGGGGGATADGDRNMIAVTGVSPTGAAVLYLVDTRTKRLAVYQGSGKNIELVAARNIKYDLELESYNDSSADEYKVHRLRAEWQKHQQGGRGGENGK